MTFRRFFFPVFTLVLLSSACAMMPKEVQRPIPQDHLSEIQRPDIPLVMNDRVQDWLRFFQGSGRSRFELYLSRSGKYIPMMRKILREHGLPQDLVYLAMIESGFNPHAYSRARATGTWQFIYRTGLRYGLITNNWIDERRDPEKSTVAAAKYLKELYDRFNNWYLAAAGYNAGEGKIDRAIRRYATEDFWELARRRYLRMETKDYVPKLIAAALISKDPEKYGFQGIVYEEPISFDELIVEGPLDLRVAARCAGVSYEEIKGLNPELLHWITPPDYPDYLLKIPEGTAGRCEENLAALEPLEKIGQSGVTVKAATTVRGFARLHRVSPVLLAAANGRSLDALIRRGETVILPYDPPPGESFREKVFERRRKSSHRKGRRTALASHTIEPGPSADQSYLRYRVRSGETLDKIARKYGVSAHELRKLNRISTARPLRHRRTIKIPAGQGTAERAL